MAIPNSLANSTKALSAGCSVVRSTGVTLCAESRLITASSRVFPSGSCMVILPGNREEPMRAWMKAYMMFKGKENKGC